VTDLLIRQKCEVMIEYGYVALRQFPKFERHVLAAEICGAMWGLDNRQPRITEWQLLRYKWDKLQIAGTQQWEMA